MAAFGDEHRKRISRGVRRAWEKRREREGARPAHVDAWLREGRIAPELAPILEVRAQQAEAMMRELGGPDKVTAMQKAVLDTWLQAQVVADVEFARVARGDSDGGPERRIPTLLNSARAALVALGLERRAKDVIDLGGGDTLNLEGVPPDRRQAIEEHQQLREVFEECMDRMTEHIEETHPGLLSTMCATDQRKWLGGLLAEAAGPVAKSLEDMESEGSV